MATTNFTTDNALTKKAWEEKLYRDASKDSYFSKFMGEGSDNIVQVNNKLSKDSGDEITFGIRMRLSGAGVGEGTQLEGNEEALTTHNFKVTLAQARHAVRDAGAMARQRALFTISTEARSALKDWLSEKQDALKFTALASAPTRCFYHVDTTYSTTGTYATAKAALNATTSKITPQLLDFAKAWALTGGNRAQTPLRPVKIKGKMYFAVVMHPDVAYDLRQDTKWFETVQNALPRDEENPIFSGALGVWNGMVLHDHESVPIYLNGGGGAVPGSDIYLMGAQSLCWANGQRMPIVEKKFDYDNEVGHALGMIYGVGKPKFNSKDYGSVCIPVARTRISDAA